MKKLDYVDYFFIALIMLFLGWLTACKETTSVEKPTPVPTPIFSPTPVVRYAWNNLLWDAELNDAIFREGLLNVNPADAKEFNLNPKSMESWGKILVMMAKFESNWKPQTTYQENFNDRFGNPIISTGLFQISIESSNGRGCAFKNQQELFDPIKNIKCSVKMFAYYVKLDNRIAGNISGKWRGGARYWAVLRGTTTHTKKALESIKKANN